MTQKLFLNGLNYFGFRDFFLLNLLAIPTQKNTVRLTIYPSLVMGDWKTNRFIPLAQSETETVSSPTPFLTTMSITLSITILINTFYTIIWFLVTAPT